MSKLVVRLTDTPKPFPDLATVQFGTVSVEVLPCRCDRPRFIYIECDGRADGVGLLTEL